MPKKNAEMPPTKDRHLSVWLTSDQADQFARAAAAEDEDKPSRWLRKLGLKRARELGITAEPAAPHGKARR